MRNPGLDRNFNKFWTGESLSHFAVQLGAVALPGLRPIVWCTDPVTVSLQT